jgi:glycine/serine hydroxymethyltransferase
MGARAFPEGRIIVATESVFSMDGDWALLPEIVALKNKYGAFLLVDEAHALESSATTAAAWPTSSVSPRRSTSIWAP